MYSIFFTCPRKLIARDDSTSVTLNTLMTGREEATIYAARPAVTSIMKKPLLPRHGNERGAKITTPRAANVSARRNECANNPVEPAAIQAAARPAVAAITISDVEDLTAGQSVVNSSDIFSLFRTTRGIISHTIRRAIRKICMLDKRFNEIEIQIVILTLRQFYYNYPVILVMNNKMSVFFNKREAPTK
jgi:hypothetical protein